MTASPTPPKTAADQAPDPSLFDRDMAELTRRNPGRAWLVLAVVAALGLTGLSAWRQGWFTPTAAVYVELPGITGVQVGTPVKLKGFKIGEVDELELMPDLNVKLRLRVVLQRLPLLAADASAHFGRDGPIGGKFIEINPGTRGMARLAANATLPMEAGTELDDVMATVKDAVEKLATAIGKVDPILDDTKKLTGEASAVSTDVRKSLTTMLQNMEAISAQLKRVGDTATRVVSHADEDRAHLVADLRKALAAATQATETANATLKAVDKELPVLLGKAQQSASDVNQITSDAKNISADARQQLPPALRAGRTVVQDAADITAGAKRLWPLSTVTGVPPDANLPLDGFEGGSK
jgi:phospholipid/cholesterol/gamma-HCH transport system substrate-binding protein